MRIPEFDASPAEIRGFAVVQVLLVGAFLAVLFWAFGGRDGTIPAWWLIIPLLAAPAAAAFFAERVWLDARPLDPAEPPEELQAEAVSVFAGQTLLKLYYCTASIIFAIIVGFVFRNCAGWPILIGGVPSLAVMAFEIWPSARNTSMTEVMLNANGAESKLVQTFLT
ncbi:MAG: hypothetical protein ACJ71Z_09730 [Aeromicrobium sp.]